MNEYLMDLADRAAKSAAQAAILGIGVESADVNAFAIDWRLCLGMALGGALLSLLTNIAHRGISGRDILRQPIHLGSLHDSDAE